MKVDLNFDLLGLDGIALTNGNAGKLVANHLASSSEGDSLKMWDWALKLNRGEELDLDPSDLIALKEFVTENTQFTVLAKAQILAKLEAVKPKK